MAARWGGVGTVVALQRVAEAYGVSRGWINKLFYDGSVAVSRERRRELALRAADYIDKVCDERDRKTTILRVLAAEKRNREQQPTLPLEPGCVTPLPEWAA